MQTLLSPDTSHSELICVRAGILSNATGRSAIPAISLSQFTFHVAAAATTACVRSCPYIPGAQRMRWRSGRLEGWVL